MPNSSDRTPTRELAAIMFSDIAGYTAIMGRDEQTALRALAGHRELLRSLLPRFNGRMLGEVGDGTLSSFHSATDAVNCARELQSALAESPEFQVRIGIHIGDVLFADDNAWGDGVNVASRIHALAAPGGICVSEHVYDEIRNKPGTQSKYLGQKHLKNVSRPIGVYSLAGSRSSAQEELPPRSLATAVLGRLLPGRKSLVAAGVAVLLLFSGYVVYRAYYPEIATAVVLYLPRILPKAVDQKMGVCATGDGVHVAYATSGKGPPLVIVLGWITHLERGFLSPVYFGDVLKDIGARHLVVRYDGRGFGLSDRAVGDYSLEARVHDLEAVTDALKLKRFALYAISAGGPITIAYAARHPERVSRIVFFGSFARLVRDAADRQKWQAMVTLMRTGWGSDNAAFRQMFTSLFMPDGTEVDMRVFNEMQRVSATPEDAAAFISATLDIDVRGLASKIRAPVLVAHVRGDQAVPLDLGKELATLIPGARLVVIEGRDHAFVPGDGEAEQLTPTVTQFLDEDTEAARAAGSGGPQ